MSWIQLYGSEYYDFNDSALNNVNDISIETIAHSLAYQCRFNGHCNKFYCPTPDQRVLTSDLRWVNAGDLRVGDGLFSFDEFPIEVGSTGKRRRRVRPSLVRTIVPVKRDVIRLELEDGSSVLSSAEHPWLIATKKSRNQKWSTTRDINIDISNGKNRYMHKFISPWKINTSHKSGWLSGIYDGEGYISIYNRRGTQLGVSQKPGLVLEEMKTVLSDLGFNFSDYAAGASETRSLQLRGGWRKIIELLGTIRPIRLLNKFEESLRKDIFNKQFDGDGHPLKIVAAYKEGEQWVTGIETSTHTYICEGFGAHNSVAEHSCRVAARVEELSDGDTKAVLYALMHDASEAILCDIPRPVKILEGAKWYRDLEESIQNALSYLHVGSFDSYEKAVGWTKQADFELLATEKEQIMSGAPNDWGYLPEPLDMNITGFGPDKAKELFLKSYYYLVGKNAPEKEE